MTQQSTLQPTQQQLEGLQARRSALTDQLESQTVRRDYLNQQLAHASGPVAATLHAEIDALDASVKQTTDALARIDAAVSTAATTGLPSSYTSEASAINARIEQFERAVVKVGTLGAVGLVAVFVLLIQSFRRRRPAPGFSRDDANRLDHLQHAVDSIAIEVERISEAQRFMARTAAEDRKISG